LNNKGKFKVVRVDLANVCGQITLQSRLNLAFRTTLFQSTSAEHIQSQLGLIFELPPNESLTWCSFIDDCETCGEQGLSLIFNNLFDALKSFASVRVFFASSTIDSIPSISPGHHLGHSLDDIQNLFGPHLALLK
jgi:hypothetical protein